MSTKSKNKKLPDWFKGIIYKKGATVQNPFSGEEYELDNIELSLYDFILGCQWTFEMAPNSVTPKRVKEFDKALTWFRINNPEAYMVLLD